MSKREIYKGDWSVMDCDCDILDKRKSTFNYVMYMLDRTNEMFEYTGLPDTIPAEWLELYLQVNGQVAITEVEGNLYAVPGFFGGAPDPYNRPTLYVAALPAFGDRLKSPMRVVNYFDAYNKDQGARGDCVVIKNDTNMQGMWYMFTRYAKQMTENDISIRSAQINARAQIVMAATTDREIASAEAYIQGLEAGKLEAVADNEFLGGIRTTNVSPTTGNTLIQLIELQQYLKASWYNEIGLNANFNMKREYQSEEELAANTDVLLPMIDNMLKCRNEALAVVNSFYGTNIEVRKNSSWENKQDDRDLEQDQKEADLKATISETEGDQDGVPMSDE